MNMPAPPRWIPATCNDLTVGWGFGSDRSPILFRPTVPELADLDGWHRHPCRFAATVHNRLGVTEDTIPAQVESPLTATVTARVREKLGSLCCDIRRGVVGVYAFDGGLFLIENSIAAMSPEITLELWEAVRDVDGVNAVSVQFRTMLQVKEWGRLYRDRSLPWEAVFHRAAVITAERLATVRDDITKAGFLIDADLAEAITTVPALRLGLQRSDPPSS